MVRLLILSAFVACAVCAPAPEEDVFRYENAEDGSHHYMTGEPGFDVAGGWGFKSPEGAAFELTYKANELGFQPEAEYLPVQVPDTEEVAEAKATFRTAYSAFQAKVEQAIKDAQDEEAVEVIAVEKRSAADEEEKPEVEVEVKPKPVYYQSYYYPGAHLVQPLFVPQYRPLVPVKVEKEVKKKVDEEEEVEEVKVTQQQQQQRFVYYPSAFGTHHYYQQTAPVRFIYHPSMVVKPVNVVPNVPEAEQEGAVTA